MRMIPSRYLVVAGTFLLSVLLYVDRVCISTAKGPITSELGLMDTLFGWVMSAFAIGYALFQTPSGMLADKLGGRPSPLPHETSGSRSLCHCRSLD